MKRTKPLRQSKPKRPQAKPPKVPKASAPSIASELDAMTEELLTAEAGMRHSTSNIAWTRRPKAWVAEIWGAMAKPNRNRAAANLRAGGFVVETSDEDCESRHRASYFVEVRGREGAVPASPTAVPPSSAVVPAGEDDDEGEDPLEDEVRSDADRELARQMREAREKHAADLVAPAPDPAVGRMDGTDCGVIGPRGAACVLLQGHEDQHCDLVGRTWGERKQGKPKSTAIVTTQHVGGALLTVERAREFLATSRNLDEVKDVADRAKALGLYMRTRDASIESQNDAAEIRLRAERRLGELTRDAPKAKGTELAGRDAFGGPKLRPPKVAGPKTLAEQGIRKQDAAKWQQIAAIPKAKFDLLIETTRAKGERITSSAPLKLVRHDAKMRMASDLRAKPVPMPMGKFDVIASDPSWEYDKRQGDVTQRGRTPYPTMSVEEICALPVLERAEDNCILWLWTTNAFMRQAYVVLDAWGFAERTILTWDKGRIGTGDWLRGQTEHCILAIRGRPIVQLTNEATILHGAVREHSRKPESFYELVDKLCPGTKLEMFSQTPRSGWAAWGAETNKFAAKGAA